jgi:RNA-binding protein
MPEPTNPKKQSLMPSTPLRRQLRSLGHALNPVIQVGKQGMTAALSKQLTTALFDHELIKIKISTECPSNRFEIAETLSKEPGVRIAQILGRTLLLYKRHPKHPKIESASKRKTP